MPEWNRQHRVDRKQGSFVEAYMVREGRATRSSSRTTKVRPMTLIKGEIEIPSERQRLKAPSILVV